MDNGSNKQAENSTNKNITEESNNMQNREENKDDKYGAEGLRIHWILVVVAIFLTFLLSYVNQVSLFESLRRSFYAGAAFWFISEIMDYFFKRKG